MNNQRFMLLQSTIAFFEDTLSNHTLNRDQIVEISDIVDDIIEELEKELIVKRE